MKVLLINPWLGEVFPPPSLGYIQAALKHWNIEVIAMDLQEALQYKGDYDIIGVSFHSFSVKFARQIRSHFPGWLICGGHHPSAMSQQMLAEGYNQVVIGEGENAIISIIQGNRDPLVYSHEFEHKYFYDINEFPIPDYSGFRFTGEMGIPVISSRGCPFACSFCASSDFWKHQYRVRSPENVLWEIEQRKSEGYKTWMFEDDNFTLNRERIFAICKGLDGKLTWQCASRAETLDDELCWELYRAGCRTVWLGIESLSQSSLDRCKKNTTVDKMIRGIKSAGRNGIATRCQLIIGLPGDSINDIQITRDVCKQNNIAAGCNIAWVLPGTEIYNQAKQRGFRDEQFLETGAPFYTYEQPMYTLIKWQSIISN